MIHSLGAANLACGLTAAPRKRRRRIMLATAMKQAAKAGIEVARYDIEPDGRISIVTGKNEIDHTNDLDKWIAKHAD
jgi:hypothetical protein